MIKRWVFQEILEEGTVELGTSVQETIERLDDMELTSCTTDTEELPLYCACTKKGRLHVARHTGRGMSDDWAHTDSLSYYLQGQVYNDEGRTRVYYRVVHDKGNRLWTYITVASFALFTAIGVALAAYSLLAGARIGTWKDARFLFAVGLAAVALLGHLLFRRGQKHPKGTAPPELKAFFLDRLEAVERWND